MQTPLGPARFLPNSQPPLRDPLTGLYDQEYFMAVLEELIQKKPQQAEFTTVALLQLENFYEIRSWVGKSEANLLLGDIAQLLEKTLPVDALLCRCQHYEFAVLLLGDNGVKAQRIAAAIKTGLRKGLTSSIPPQLQLHYGIGMASADNEILKAEVLFARARHDLSLSHSRHKFRSSALSAVPIEPERILLLVQTALQSSSFGLLFQATLCFKNDDLKHFEIRSQFRDEEGSKLPSELVFESAIQNALGEQLDRRVILEALKTLGLTRNQQLRFTINLTQNSIVSADFFPWLESVLKNYPALSGQLVFQLSEIDILIAQHHMEYFCQMLSQLDIRLSISNFGCTLDPFRYLSLLRAHYVKLDVSLLKKLGREHIRQQNLISLVSEIQDNGLQVIAPLIERSSFLPLLWQAGIEFAQGNVIHKPEQKLNLQLLEHEEITIQ
ncbi:MAG: GGDEF domain-containing protein [Gammaproteobacteria bacterium]|jgi:diguanylate cyclase (GGDEF)-like protein|nr:hypothetical protein [Gammaproteobacteria bacterium]MDP6097784.1 GGDEF domain-containing protein [Gammaproteobacteria bacterium]HJO12904.1 GGDEF domain-containing protein [Gammaproteobacteria bacterium]